MTVQSRKSEPPEDLAAAVAAGDRGALARAITLVESSLPADRGPAQEVLEILLPRTGAARRIGISGAPGVGKSTLIDALGVRLAERGERVAVLAVDPSSALSGGSILGDKSRMGALASHENAYIRPSPSAATLGGVARRTRESMLLAEAAGYNVVIVETVGVGQSEARVAEMVDFFLVLLLPGGGDELQGIKRGILELADALAVTKADGGQKTLATRARADYAAGLAFLRPRGAAWKPPVVTVSALTGEGLEELWELARRHRAALTASGEHEARRVEQRQHWVWSEIEDRLGEAFRAHPAVAERRAEIERRVTEGSLTASRAADELLAAFGIAPEAQ